MKIKTLAISLFASLGIGAMSALFTLNSTKIYEHLNKPALAPPANIFPIIWTILFILMGISSYLIYISNNPTKNHALKIYILQLIINFIWPLLFFNCQLYLISFIWIILLWLIILAMIISFYKINYLASILQIPYFLWVTFASYLNIMVYLLNR